MDGGSPTSLAVDVGSSAHSRAARSEVGQRLCNCCPILLTRGLTTASCNDYTLSFSFSAIPEVVGRATAERPLVPHYTCKPRCRPHQAPLPSDVGFRSTHPNLQSCLTASHEENHNSIDDEGMLEAGLTERSATRGTLASICADLVGTPDPQPIRGSLNAPRCVEDLPKLQGRRNAAVAAEVPPRVRRHAYEVAIDYQDRPYDGKVAQAVGLWVRGRATDGTPRFYRVATAVPAAGGAGLRPPSPPTALSCWPGPLSCSLWGASALDLHPSAPPRRALAGHNTVPVTPLHQVSSPCLGATLWMYTNRDRSCRTPVLRNSVY